jgi:hypothetical protein
MEVPNDPALVGKSWDDLAALTPPILKEPRPLTNDEIAAQAAAEQAAAAAAEAARVASLVVTKFQAKAALLNAGLLDDVEAAVAAADALTKLAWADAQEFRRRSPLIADLAAALDPPLTSEQLDALFVAASTIVA